MLAADQRVRRGSEFAAAIRAGRRAGRGALVVHLLTPAPSTLERSMASVTMAAPIEPATAGEHSPPRAGFVVPKAVGNAVARNLVRRRLRHLVRERLGALPAGATLIVRAQAGAAGLPYADLGQQLDGALVTASRPRSPGRR